MSQMRENEDAQATRNLRERAEALLSAKPADVPTMPTEDVQELVHELNVHQIELEIQNEELRQAQLELAHTRDRYADLYEFAPTGYVTLDSDGKILSANLTAATMLGVERQQLLQTNLAKFVVREWGDAFYLHRQAVFSRVTKETCELQMKPADGTLRTVRLESVAFDLEAERHCRTTLIDVSELQKAEEALQLLNEELEERVAEQTSEIRLLAAAISYLGEGVLITSDHLEWPGPHIVFVNEALCRITGYTAHELIGQSPRLLQGDDTDRETLDRIKAELSAGRSVLAELTNYRKDGTPYDAELFITPLFESSPTRPSLAEQSSDSADDQSLATSATGRRTNFVSIHRDVTERKHAEESLRREHELSEGIIGSSRHIILVLDTDGRIVRINPYMEGLSGWQLDEVQSRDWFDTFLPERDREKIRSLFGRAIQDERTSGHINPIVTKDGRELQIEWYDAPLTSPEGDLIGLLCTGQDITKRLQSEAALRDHEERLRAILNTASDAIINIDQQGIITDVNPATERMFGYAQEELVGQNVKILMPPPYHGEHDGYIARYLQTGEARIIGMGREVVARHKNGATFPVDLAVSQVDHLGIFTGVVRDVSAVKELQKQVLEIAAEEDRRIGHELHDNVQQQLTGLGLLAKSVADRLADVRESETGLFEKAGLLDRVTETGNMASRVADGISDSAKHVHLLSRGLVPVEIDREGLRSSLEDFAVRIAEQFRVACEFDCDGFIEVADNFVATHLYRIAQEAVNNAIKHGRPNQINISLSGTGEALVLKVLDNGIGIGEKREDGTGTGLRIMQHRAGLIGATVQVAPRDERGTQVICTVLRGGG